MRKSVRIPNDLWFLREIQIDAFLAVLRSRTFLCTFAVLLAVDAAFILLHVLNVLASKSIIDIGGLTSVVAQDEMRLDQDNGYSERYEYLKSASCIVLFGACYVRRRQPVYLALMGAYVLILLDNALSLHEWVGTRLTPEDVELGQLVAFVGLGFLICSTIWWTWPRHRLQDQAYAAGSILFLGGIAFFSVAVDLVHDFLPRFIANANQLLALLEDGGELATLSLSLAFVWAVAMDSRSINSVVNEAEHGSSARTRLHG